MLNTTLSRNARTACVQLPRRPLSPTSRTPSSSHAHSPSQEPGAYPGPLTELNFWSERAANLNSIHEQLTGEKIQKVVTVLELAKSTYYPAFQRLFREVDAARQEANDNVKFLKPLRKYVEKLNMMDDFPLLVDLFKPIMHTLMLIWKYSKSYNSSTRFVTIMQEICNDLIMQVGAGIVRCAVLSGAAQGPCPSCGWRWVAAVRMARLLKCCSCLSRWHLHWVTADLTVHPGR